MNFQTLKQERLMCVLCIAGRVLSIETLNILYKGGDKHVQIDPDQTSWTKNYDHMRVNQYVSTMRVFFVIGQPAGEKIGTNCFHFFNF